MSSIYNNVAFIVCPSQELERPPAAAAALAGVMARNKVDYKIYDLNLELYHVLSHDDWMLCERKWRIDSTVELPKAFYVWIDNTIDTITASKHDLIAISVFTKFSSRFSEMFLQRLRARISTTVIAGGQGLGTPWGNTKFGKMLFDRKLVDYVADGDGEVIFDNFLKGITDSPGLNFTVPEQINDLDNIPYPVFEQIDPKNYIYHQDPGVYLTASRGCVRKCKFCDVPSRWPKYRYRKGKDIAKELYAHYKSVGVSVVQFTDSVINGVIPEFEKLQDAIINYKRQDPEFNPRWLSQFNIRQRKDMPDRIYQKMSEAGASVLVCGVEHASWRIREAMGKEFDNDDLDHHIKMCAKYGIQNVFLMFIGYPSETAEDHKEMLEFLEKYQKYCLAGTIMVIRWGYTGSMDHGSRMELKQDKMEIVPEWPDFKLMSVDDHTQDWIYGRNWVNLNNPTLTFKERIRRRLDVHKKSVEFEWPITRGKEELEALKLICEVYAKQDISKVNIIEDTGDH
jgi:radical SAM superfamily enzyme YgiQ (UPF0313 family)